MNSIKAHLVRPVTRPVWHSNIVSTGVLSLDGTEFGGREGVGGVGEGVENIEGGAAEGAQGQICSITSLTLRN